MAFYLLDKFSIQFIMYNLNLLTKIQKIPKRVLFLNLISSSRLSQKSSGFTLVELIAVVVMVGVLSAVAVPSWLGFVNRQRLSKANDTILAALQEAQREARRLKITYSVSFRTNNNSPEIAIHPGSTPSNWRNLAEEIGINPREIILGTNLSAKNTAVNSGVVSFPNSNTAQTISFDYMGTLDLTVRTNSDSLTSVQNTKLGSKGLIVAIATSEPGNPTQASNLRRCVIVKTLLGSMQTGKNTECQ